MPGSQNPEAVQDTGHAPPEEGAQLQAVIHGRVQGVNFRYFTCRRAAELGLKGYVRNSWDGTVEVVAEGSRQGLAELLTFLRVGPSIAWVERVDTQWGVATGEYWSFEVRY